jgi:signal transduction histidine kinase
MVLGKTLHLELPRRVVVYYLLFCLLAVIWLLLGGVMAARLVIRSRSENNALTQLERVSSKLEIAYLRSGLDELQRQVQQIKEDHKLSYCAVADAEGHYLAHSIPSRVGRSVMDPAGERQSWGEIECIAYDDDRGRTLREFRFPLRNGSEMFGTLHMGTRHANALAMILSSGEILPITLLGPILMLGVGAVVLQRVVRPLSDVDAQLRKIAVAPDVARFPLKKVRVRGPGSLGWNRLIGEVEAGGVRSDFQQRVGDSIQARSKSRSHMLLNSLSEGIATTDDQGMITFANHAFLAYAGRTPEEGVPRDCTVEDCLDLRSIAPDSPILALHQNTRSLITEIQRTDEAGQRWLRLARHPIRGDERQSGNGHIWTIRDVTQQKLADKMRDEFLDSATHELRTPLTNIRAYAETLVTSSKLDIEQQKEFCNTINTEATRLARLIDDLLSVSSMEAGSLSIRRKNTDVARLLREVADKVRGQMDQKEITFETILSEKIPEMSIDKDKISTTLVNLLGNAAKYTPEGGRVALKARVEDGNLLVEVEDSGIGIAPEELPKVFDKFFRSQDARVRDITGTGLGLALAHEVVRLHGGNLTVRSELNVGTTFAMALKVG